MGCLRSRSGWSRKSLYTIVHFFSGVCRVSRLRQLNTKCILSSVSAQTAFGRLLYYYPSYFEFRCPTRESHEWLVPSEYSFFPRRKWMSTLLALLRDPEQTTRSRFFREFQFTLHDAFPIVPISLSCEILPQTTCSIWIQSVYASTYFRTPTTPTPHPHPALPVPHPHPPLTLTLTPTPTPWISADNFPGRWFRKQYFNDFRRKPAGYLLFSDWKRPENTPNPAEKSCDRIRFPFMGRSNWFQAELARSGHRIPWPGLSLSNGRHNFSIPVTPVVLG